MLPVLIPISALLLSDALLLVGHGLLLTLLPIVATESGFSDTQVALTGSGYFIGFVSGCLATPYIVRRVGHIRSFAVLATLYSAVVLVFPLLPLFLSWLLLRLVIGASVAGLYMIIESWLNERATAQNRGTILSVYTHAEPFDDDHQPTIAQHQLSHQRSTVCARGYPGITGDNTGITDLNAGPGAAAKSKNQPA